jgi:thiamine kinase-like enzyme
VIRHVRIMATSIVDSKNEIKSWLKTVLEKENLKDISIDDLATPGKGDGYLGDIVFASVSGRTQEESTKIYDLVLKCSKRSQALRKTSSLVQIFMNEIFVYRELFPSFANFEKEKKVENPFISMAKCYGSFVGDNIEVIVLENLKKNGYDLWPKNEPLTRSHIELVIKEYGKYHAISVAMREQQPDKFQKLVDISEQNINKLTGFDSIDVAFRSCIEESYELLKNDIDEEILLKWRNFKDQVKSLYEDVNKSVTGLKVITHGDCWNNNFMYKYNNDKSPIKVAILDWQFAKYTSLIFDLSYFLFACVSKDDIKDLEDILKVYYESFTNHLKCLGVEEPNAFYPFHQLLEEWKNYSRYGILSSTLATKFTSADEDEVVDLAEAADRGNASQSFMIQLRNTDHFKSRMQFIVPYVVTHELV